MKCLHCFKVEAIHPYAGEDTDELTFETGDLINVVPYDDPEEQVMLSIHVLVYNIIPSLMRLPFLPGNHGQISDLSFGEEFQMHSA